MGEQIGVARPEKTRQGLKPLLGTRPPPRHIVARPEKTRQGLKQIVTGGESRPQLQRCKA